MCTKRPMLGVDDTNFEDATSSSNSDAEEVESDAFELVKRAGHDGASGSRAADTNPSVDGGQEKW